MAGLAKSEKSENSTTRQTGRHVLDLDPGLLAAAQGRLGTATARATIAAAVDSHLPQVIELLKQAGVVSRPTGRRQPRKVDIRTWDALTAAEGQIPLAAIELLRACLYRAAHQDEPASQAGSDHQ